MQIYYKKGLYSCQAKSMLAFPYFFTRAIFSFDAGLYVLLSLVFVYTGQ